MGWAQFNEQHRSGAVVSQFSEHIPAVEKRGVCSVVNSVLGLSGSSSMGIFPKMGIFHHTRGSFTNYVMARG